MSERAQVWVEGLRAQNPDWEYVLWDDETNRMLVEQYCPWFLQSYDSLPQEILRADVVRNLYMYIFGG
jgi:mannosyltransferase OCH1-like enzyme